MSKARLIITAVVDEKRAKSEVARDYDVSRYWVQQLVRRYLAEGEAAFEPHSRRPHTSPHAVPAGVEDEIVRLRKGAVPAGTGRRRGHHPHPPGPSHSEVADLVEDRTALGLDDLADPGPARIPHPPAAEETTLVLAPVRSRTAQPALAGRHDSLAARRRHTDRDPQPSRRPLPSRPGVCPAAHHHRTRRRRRLRGRLRALGNPRQRAHRQRGQSSPAAPPRRQGRPRDRARPPRRPVRPLTSQPSTDPRQGRTLPADREEVAPRVAPGQDHRRPAAPAHPIPPLLQRGPPAPGPGPPDPL